MPVLNGIYKYSWANEVTAVDADLSGPSYVWDFSFLSASSVDADTFVPVSSTPFAYQFYFNNQILYPEWKASYAMSAPGFQLGNISLQDVYYYYKNDPSDYKYVGYGASINSIPSSVRNDPIDFIYRFPLDYGNSDSCQSAYGFNVPSIGYFGVSQKRINTVDGWGTLILPHDTFQVLRVKSVLYKTDTIYIDSLSVGSSIPQPVQVEYKWLANGQGEPVMQANASIILNNTVVSSVRYYDSQPAGIEQALPTANAIIYPNPASDVLHIVLRGGSEKAGIASLHDALGKKCLESHFTGGEFTLSLGHLPQGTYYVRLKSPDGVFFSGAFAVCR
ncbi:MAG: T9SS type A sorting domain-containing protein [Flavobacteriales bacterium]